MYRAGSMESNETMRNSWSLRQLVSRASKTYRARFEDLANTAAYNTGCVRIVFGAYVSENGVPKRHVVLANIAALTSRTALVTS